MSTYTGEGPRKHPGVHPGVAEKPGGFGAAPVIPTGRYSKISTRQTRGFRSQGDPRRTSWRKRCFAECHE